MTDTATPALTLAEVPELRRKTEAVSKFLQQQISAALPA